MHAPPRIARGAQAADGEGERTTDKRRTCSKNVSLEFRNGTCPPLVFEAPPLERFADCFPLSTSAATTSPSAESERLMFCASTKRCPLASVFEIRSEPARSIRRSYVFFTRGGRQR
jgi:hypothetical protein